MFGCGGASVGVPRTGAATAVGCGGARVGSVRGCKAERGCVGAGGAGVNVGAGAVAGGTRICNCELGLPPPDALASPPAVELEYGELEYDGAAYDGVARFTSPMRSVLRCGEAPLSLLRVDCASDSSVDHATSTHASAARLKKFRRKPT